MLFVFTRTAWSERNPRIDDWNAVLPPWNHASPTGGGVGTGSGLGGAGGEASCLISLINPVTRSHIKVTAGHSTGAVVVRALLIKFRE